MKLVDLIPLKEMYNPADAFNKKVSRMTDNNDHSSAAVELAIYMDDKDAVRKLQQIKKQHDKDGSISPEAAKLTLQIALKFLLVRMSMEHLWVALR